MKRALEARTLNLEPDAGFTLIELLIVMSIMLIIMAFAIPQILQLKKKANQASAQQTMRVIASAEDSYNQSGAGFVCPLASLGGDPKSGAPTAEAARCGAVTIPFSPVTVSLMASAYPKQCPLDTQPSGCLLSVCG